MGFFNKVKKALGSKKEDVESQNNSEAMANKEINDKIRNFQYLDDLIHSGAKEIVLDSDIVLDDDEKWQYSDGIKLDVDDLVIDGKGHTINAKEKTRIFYCTGENIIIKNITLKKGFTKNGGAIYNSGEITISHSTLTENTAKNDGGAIYNERGDELTIIESILTENISTKGGAIHNKGSLTITDSTFTENITKGEYSSGGAIYNSGEITITCSTIQENTSQEDGGAIRNDVGELTITESTLQQNTANRDGGAIYNRGGELTITSSTLTENMAENDGGAIYNFSGEITITSSTLTENMAENDGGAIYNDIGEITIIDSTLQQNTAKYDGGATYNTLVGSLTITKTAFNENIANERGMDIFNNGQIFSKENISKIIQVHNELGKFYHLKPLKNNQKDFTYLNELINAETNEIKLENDIILNIENNEQKTFENGIEIDRDNLVIDGNGHTIDAQGKTRIFHCSGKNITIKNITLKNGFSKDYGGVIFHKDGDLTITKSTFTENTSRHGGAIYNEGNDELTIIESTLTENTSTKGGAIYNKGNDELTIIESTLTENTSQEDGGAIYNSGEITITSSTLTENTSQEDGGAIYNSGEITIASSTLIENMAENDGGAIENVYGGRLNISGCKILSNKSQNNIIFNEFFMEVQNTKFNNNQSEHVLVNEYLEFNISIIDSEFIGNNVDKDVIFNNGKSCTIQNTIFENNLSRNITNKTDLILISPKIKDDGQSILNDGHILIKQSSDLESKIYGDGTVETDAIPEETFDFEYLDKKIHESKSKEIILNHDITFENYEIDYYEGGIELSIDDLVIDGNGHTIDGANKSRIFIVTGKNITLKNITFKNGVTHDNYHYHFNISGGAIRINHNAKITIENCKFINNLSENNGGAIDNNGGKLDISETTFKENTANRYGGAILNGGRLSISKSELTDNKAQYRGGAIFSGGNSIIEESVLVGNAARYGGAVYNDNSKLNIERSDIIENTAEDGGSIYNNEGCLTIAETRFSNNVAEEWGGSIYNNTGKLSIELSLFNKNTAGRDGGALNNYWRKVI